MIVKCYICLYVIVFLYMNGLCIYILFFNFVILIELVCGGGFGYFVFLEDF